MKKMTCFTELSYVLALILMAFGTCLMEKADFGMSMIVAPSYVMYLKLSAFFPWLTFGMSCYLFQALLLLFMMLLLRRARIYYLFSFVTAVLYGLTLDAWIFLLGDLTADTLPMRIFCYLVGLITCATGVAFIFRTYIAPEVYELFVKEYVDAHNSRHAKKPITISVCKTAYDCISCVLALAMSFCFFGWMQFQGVGVGTILCALVNGTLIGLMDKWMEKHLRFRDALPLRRYFES